METLYIHLIGSDTHRVSSQSGPSDLLYSQKWIKVIFFIYGLSRYIEPSDLVHTLTYSKCLELYWFASLLDTIWPLGGHKQSEGGSQESSPSPESFRSFFLHVFRYELEIWYAYPLGGMTSQAWVSSQSGPCPWIIFQTCFFIFEVSVESCFIHSVRLHQQIEFMFQQNGIPVTYIMFLSYAQITNKALFTDACKRVY